MECEICGKQISDTNPIRAKIEGSVMLVCKECSKLGKIQKTPPKPKFQQTKNPNKNKKSKPKVTRRDEPSEELIENFNEEIRKAREARNWSREVLGKKINERVSVINRIESGKMIPDIKLTKKFEKILDITLLEKFDEIDLNQYINSGENGRTLGNIVKIKKK